jgi:hypothetical protein
MVNNKLTSEEFDAIINEELDAIKELLTVKGKEYRRNNDVLHNFNQGSLETGQTRERVLDGFMLKHRISYRDILNDLDKGIIPDIKLVNEKIRDILVYFLLQKASLTQTIKEHDNTR